MKESMIFAASPSSPAEGSRQAFEWLEEFAIVPNQSRFRRSWQLRLASTPHIRIQVRLFRSSPFTVTGFVLYFRSLSHDRHAITLAFVTLFESLSVDSFQMATWRCSATWMTTIMCPKVPRDSDQGVHYVQLS
jgi:hypothetical protein